MAKLIPVVYRRDMLGEYCIVCTHGTYEESGQYGDVQCTRCHRYFRRWSTKKEILMEKSLAGGK